jgi:hypothetical protein
MAMDPGRVRNLRVKELLAEHGFAVYSVRYGRHQFSHDLKILASHPREVWARARVVAAMKREELCRDVVWRDW